ncbi:MAG TPA: 4-hydroxyphenylacetate 3-hydroxylase N-terminal domain-containing protein [Acidimicrobiales bacterium]
MAARTGEDFIKGLRATSREIWLGGERIDGVTDHPRLAPGADAIAAYYDLQHEYPDELLMPDPETGERINVTHMQPRSVADLQRRHAGLVRIAELSMGVMGRTPDYMNVTFAGFADDRLRWAGPDGSNEEGHENLVVFQKRLRRDDLSLTHSIIHPTVDRQTDRVFEANPVPLHKVAETADSIVVRGCRLLATLAPYADEQTVYPSQPLPPGAHDYALAFTVPMDAPGLVFLCRDSGIRPEAHPVDAPFSTRFDEQDALCIFDDVEIPKRNVFINGSLDVYNSVMGLSPWWPNIMQQTTIRALTKLEFAYGLLVRMAEAVNDTSERTNELLGEVVGYIEVTRNAVLLSEQNAVTWESGGVYPEARALHPMRALLPDWFVRVNEIIRVVGSHNLLAAAGRGALDDPRIHALMTEFQPGANGISADERSAVYRVAWDFMGSLVGSRGELYERNYLTSARTNRMMSNIVYSGENRRRGAELLEKLLSDARARA